MLPRPLPIVLAALAASFAAGACAQAPSPAAQTPARAAGAAATQAPVAAPRPQVDPRLPQVRAAMEAAERGSLDAVAHAGLVDHPLYPWIELAALQRDIDALPATRARDFLSRRGGTPAGEVFRELWLASAAKRNEHVAFLDAWSDRVDSTALRCARLHALKQLGRADGRWTTQAQEIWRSSGRSLPDACDPVFAALDRDGGLDVALRWERFDKAADAWQPGVMRAIARGMAGAERALAEDYAAFFDAPHTRALQWPKTTRSRLVASQGLAALGKADPDRAEALLPQYAQALGFTEAERGRVLYQIALWTVASYLPDSARRLALVPDASYDARLHEWQVREALARSDWRAALAAIRRMGPEQRADSRWRYFEARVTELTGDAASARELYRQAAREPEFHGFLAADRVDQPYALCPREVDATAAVRAAVEADPALVRAVGLHHLGRHGWAVKEWHDALSRFDDSGRRHAVAVAQANGWFDRAVFSLGKAPGEMQLYSLRFPLHHDDIIRREAARNGIDPAWVAAEIRAESIFNPDARSPADARGLMQVLPSTGAAVARRIGQPWGGGQSLYDPETNIILGTAYLRQMMDDNGGKPYFAIAGYNAGPTPLARWQSQRPGMDADFWIETVSYKETREYVARVLAFSVIYDWRLDGDALRLSDRLEGRSGGPRKQFACPVAAPAPAPAAAAAG